jgi:flagellar motor switch protein FliM
MTDMTETSGAEAPPLEGETSPLPPLGIRAMIESNVISQVQLPLLEVVCDRMVRTFSTSMRNLTSGAVEVELKQLVSLRFGEFLNRQEGRSVLGVFTIVELENFGLITLDNQLARHVIETLLGNRGASQQGETPPISENRSFTQLEIKLVGHMLEVALADLQEAFKEVREVQMKLDRIETGIHFATITGMSNVAVVAEFSVGIRSEFGIMSVLLPYTTIEPVREKLQQKFMGEQVNLQSVWDVHMQREVAAMDVEIKAVLGEQTLTVEEVQNLKPGDLIPLGVVPNTPVRIQCGDVVVSNGYFGPHDGRMAISINKPLGQ